MARANLAIGLFDLDLAVTTDFVDIENHSHVIGDDFN